MCLLKTLGWVNTNLHFIQACNAAKAAELSLPDYTLQVSPCFTSRAAGLSKALNHKHRSLDFSKDPKGQENP